MGLNVSDCCATWRLFAALLPIFRDQYITRHSTLFSKRATICNLYNFHPMFILQSPANWYSVICYGGKWPAITIVSKAVATTEYIWDLTLDVFVSATGESPNNAKPPVGAVLTTPLDMCFIIFIWSQRFFFMLVTWWRHLLLAMRSRGISRKFEC